MYGIGNEKRRSVYEREIRKTSDVLVADVIACAKERAHAVDVVRLGATSYENVSPGYEPGDRNFESSGRATAELSYHIWHNGSSSIAHAFCRRASSGRPAANSHCAYHSRK
jgi:hypothetical protein